MVRLRVAASLILAAALVVLAACGSCSPSGSHSSEGDDGGGTIEAAVETGPRPSQACAAFAAAFCGRLEACTPFALQVAYGDANTCAQRIALACAPDFTINGTQATPGQTIACADAVQAESCDDVLDNPQPSACNVPGMLDAGVPCGSGAQCESNYCPTLAANVCGACVEHVGANGHCVVDSDCSATLICNVNSCVGPVGLGAACSDTAPCMRSLTCINGTCAAPGGAGQPCAQASDCDTAHGANCNGQTKKCVQWQVAQAGQPCGIVGGNVVACAASALCVNGNDAGVGTCHAPAADGTLCGPGIACLPPAVCSSTARCTLPNPSVCH
jgi:hypothetical protein